MNCPTGRLVGSGLPRPARVRESKTSRHSRSSAVSPRSSRYLASGTRPALSCGRWALLGNTIAMWPSRHGLTRRKVGRGGAGQAGGQAARCSPQLVCDDEPHVTGMSTSGRMDVVCDMPGRALACRLASMRGGQDILCWCARVAWPGLRVARICTCACALMWVGTWCVHVLGSRKTWQSTWTEAAAPADGHACEGRCSLRAALGASPHLSSSSRGVVSSRWLTSSRVPVSTASTGVLQGMDGSGSGYAGVQGPARNGGVRAAAAVRHPLRCVGRLPSATSRAMLSSTGARRSRHTSHTPCVGCTRTGCRLRGADGMRAGVHSDAEHEAANPHPCILPAHPPLPLPPPPLPRRN